MGLDEPAGGGGIAVRSGLLAVGGCAFLFGAHPVLPGAAPARIASSLAARARSSGFDGQPLWAESALASMRCSARSRTIAGAIPIAMQMRLSVVERMSRVPCSTVLSMSALRATAAALRPLAAISARSC